MPQRLYKKALFIAEVLDFQLVLLWRAKTTEVCLLCERREGYMERTFHVVLWVLVGGECGEATGFEFKHDYTVIDSPRAVTFRDIYRVQMIMRFNEIHKFSDGTLQQIDEALDYREQGLHVRYPEKAKDMMYLSESGELCGWTDPRWRLPRLQECFSCVRAKPKLIPAIHLLEIITAQEVSFERSGIANMAIINVKGDSGGEGGGKMVLGNRDESLGKMQVWPLKVISDLANLVLVVLKLLRVGKLAPSELYLVLAKPPLLV
ncbi:hypothetical protein Tco_0607869 [Tanacetum coccineum]